MEPERKLRPSEAAPRTSLMFAYIFCKTQWLKRVDKKKVYINIWNACLPSWNLQHFGPTLNIPSRASRCEVKLVSRAFGSWGRRCCFALDIEEDLGAIRVSTALLDSLGGLKDVETVAWLTPATSWCNPPVTAERKQGAHLFIRWTNMILFLHISRLSSPCCLSLPTTVTDSSESSRPLLFCHAGAQGSFMRRLVAVFNDPVRNEGI